MKIKSSIRISIISVIMLAGFLFWQNQASAQLGITITPLRFNLEEEPGSSVGGRITVINPNDFNLRVTPGFRDFRVLGENAGIQWLPDDIENPYKMSHWIRLSKREIILRPKEERQVIFTIRVPKDASAGGHYAAIIFRGSNVGDSDSAISSFPSVGALIILNVKGEVIKTGEILALSGPRVINKGPTKFEGKFKNTGTTHYKTNAVLSIRNLFGPKDEIEFDEKFLYPNVIRNIETAWEKKRPFGLYFATLAFIDGEGEKHSETIIVFGFPWKIVLTWFLIALVVAYTLRILRRKFKIVRA